MSSPFPVSAFSPGGMELPVLRCAHPGVWQSSGSRTSAFAGAGALASRRSKCRAGGLWYVRTRRNGSGVSGASIILRSAEVLDIGDSGVAFAFCL